MSSHSTKHDKPLREEVARLLTQATERDMKAQQKLIEARARGETDEVHWEDRQDRGLPETS